MSSQTQIKALVTTDWIDEHAKNSGLRLVEVDVDPSVYEKGHIEGAVGWNWRRDLQDQLARDIAPKEALEQLLGKSGIAPDTNITRINSQLFRTNVMRSCSGKALQTK